MKCAPPARDLHSFATIDDESMACDEARLVGAEPEHRLGDVPSLPQSADWDACRNAGVVLRIASFLSHIHRGVDCAWAYGVHPDTLLGVVERGGPGQSDDAVLAGGVGRMPPGATQPHDRRVVD